jgi:tRNA threonylcarbamoyladenosine biosynthesis protein TsaE
MSGPAKRIVALPSLSATEALARAIAAMARAGDCILLEGPLGAGKTAFARAFLRAAADDPALEVPSPSFTLVQTYETKIGLVFHYDLWRIDGSADLTELDWEDALDAIVLVEWPDRLGPLRPETALTIAFRPEDGDAREATLIGWEGRLSSVAPSSWAVAPPSWPGPPPSWPGPPPSWPGLSGPPIAARAAIGGPHKPGHDEGAAQGAESRHNENDKPDPGKGNAAA